MREDRLHNYVKAIAHLNLFKSSFIFFEKNTKYMKRKKTAIVLKDRFNQIKTKSLDFLNEYRMQRRGARLELFYKQGQKRFIRSWNSLRYNYLMGYLNNFKRFEYGNRRLYREQGGGFDKGYYKNINLNIMIKNFFFSFCEKKGKNYSKENFFVVVNFLVKKLNIYLKNFKQRKAARLIRILGKYSKRKKKNKKRKIIIWLKSKKIL